MAILTDFLDFVEYSTIVEYSDGHEKILNPATDQVYPKKIMSIELLVLKILMGQHTPKNHPLLGGSSGLS